MQLADQPALGQLDEKSKRVVLFTPNGKPGRAVADAYLQHSYGSASATVQTVLPRKGRLVIDYARWSATRPKGIKAYVLSPAGKTSVKVRVSSG